MKKRIPSIDERARLWMALSTGIAALACIRWQSQILILVLAFGLCLAGRALKGVAAFLTGAVLLGAGLFLQTLETGNHTLTGTGLLLMAVKFGPFILTMVYLYNTLDASRFLRALEHTGVPAPVLVPLGVTFRFMPSFVREFTHIRDALAFRGVPVTLRTVISRPLALTEYLLIPLLMRALLIGEELSRSALARGMGAPGKKTVFRPIAFTLKDTVLCLSWTGLLVLIFAWDRATGGL